MPTLRVIDGINNPSHISNLPESQAGSPEDQIACIFKYIRSLERAAEERHGDDDDWRYGRYLVHRILNGIRAD